MRALLFRKICIDGVYYYQLFGTDDDFKQDPIYGEYHERQYCDFFYINRDSNIKIPNEEIYSIWIYLIFLKKH